jgi:hypothetical protein
LARMLACFGGGQSDRALLNDFDAEAEALGLAPPSRRR